MKPYPLSSRMALLFMEPLQVHFLPRFFLFFLQCTRVVQSFTNNINFNTELDFLTHLCTRSVKPFANNILELYWKRGFVSF